MNYDAVERHLVVLRRQSMDWLQNALSARRPAKALSTFDLLDRRIRALDHQTTETDAKQWQQLEDHRMRLDGHDAYLNNLNDRLDKFGAKLDELRNQLVNLSKQMDSNGNHHF